MNERIKQIAERAGFWASEQLPFTNPEWQELKEKKFAELIVLECVDRIKNADMTDLEGSDPDDVLWLVERQIVKHFGIEE